MHKRRRVLVVIWVLTHFKEMSRLVRFLQRDTHWQPIVMLGYVPSAPDEAKAEWDRTGVPWFVLGARPPRLDVLEVETARDFSAPATRRPRAPASATVSVRTVLAAVFGGLLLGAAGSALLLANVLAFVPLLCSFLLRPPSTRALIEPLGKSFSRQLPRPVAAVVALFFYPSWALLRRGLRACPDHTLLGRTYWMASRLILIAMSRPLTGFLQERVPGVRLLFRLATMYGLLQLARACCARMKPDLIALAEDNASYPTGIFIKAARENGAASVVIPYTLANVKEFVEGFKVDRGYSTRKPHNWLVSKCFPRWCHRHDGCGVLRLPGHHVLAMEWLGVAPPRPWVPNDGHWDAFAVESPRMRRRYLEEFGMPPERLALTGAMSDDCLWAGKRSASDLREEVYRELKLPPGRPMVLVAFPPNQFSTPRPELEFSDYKEMTSFVVESLGALNRFNVVISLHPRASAETRTHIQSLGGNICSRDTLELVPAANLYIASVSATIRWAIACGIPVINYDIFHYRYDDYDNAAGVHTAQTKSEWLELLQRCERPGLIAEAAARQQACASDWGMVDGQSAWRMVELFDRLAERDARPASKIAA